MDKNKCLLCQMTLPVWNGTESRMYPLPFSVLLTGRCAKCIPGWSCCHHCRMRNAGPYRIRPWSRQQNNFVDRLDLLGGPCDWSTRSHCLQIFVAVCCLASNWWPCGRNIGTWGIQQHTYAKGLSLNLVEGPRILRCLGTYFDCTFF